MGEITRLMKFPGVKRTFVVKIVAGLPSGESSREKRCVCLFIVSLLTQIKTFQNDTICYFQANVKENRLKTLQGLKKFDYRYKII